MATVHFIGLGNSICLPSATGNKIKILAMDFPVKQVI